jgi:hypothetical protein
MTDDMMNFLRDTMRFHFCFLIEKDRYKIGSVEDARVAIAHALQIVQRLDTGGLASAEKRRNVYVQSLRKVAEEAKANRFNYQNFFDIHILSVFLATIMLWIVRHGECRLIGLFPDRDKMTTGCGGIFNALTEINHFGFRQRIGLNTEKDIIAPSAGILGNGGDFFYDPLVRIPDYVAGALSRLDYQSRLLTSEKKKHKDLVERFASDNPNLLIIQISESLVSLQASTIRLTTKPNIFPPISCEELIEYVVAKTQGFRRPKRRSYRQGLLDHASDWPHFSSMLRSLMKGVVAGHPGCTATFLDKI